MPVTGITHDLDTRTLTITAEFAAPVERIWQVYADPRQLERVSGPPTHPATFVEHSLVPGGRMTYYMTGPEGERYHGIWRVLEVDEPHRFRFEDSFADEHFVANPDLPVSETVATFESGGAGRKAVFTSSYATAEALQQAIDMGMEEGVTLAMNQIDALVA